MPKDIPFVLHESSGFTLEYEDRDRGGSYGASHKLNAKTIEGAVTEARKFLSAPIGLPMEDTVRIVQWTHFSIDVKDLREDSKKT